MRLNHLAVESLGLGVLGLVVDLGLWLRLAPSIPPLLVATMRQVQARVRDVEPADGRHP